MPDSDTRLEPAASGMVQRAAGVRMLLRVALLLALAACTLLRLYLAVLALALAVGPGWAMVLALALLLSGWLWPLRAAVFYGALMLWHWPLLAALVIAAPRLPLMLPGLMSTFLASRRHPRPRWSSYRPV